MAESTKDTEFIALKAKLKEMLVKELSLENVTPEDIADDAPLFGDGLGLDSLDAVEIVILLQRNFALDVKDKDVARQIFQSVTTLAEYVYDHTTHA